jgi:lipopolysaccharide transport system ATP-binding protein
VPGQDGDVTGEGRTVLFVSHNMGAVRNLCQKVIWLQSGILHEQGYSFELVERYLSMGTSSSAKIVLPYDDEKPMRLREIAILNSAGEATTHLSMSSPIHVSITYDINQKIKGAHVICFITTQDGITVLGSGDADSKPERLGTRVPGQYVGKFSIPTDLLGEGQYYLTVSLGIPFVSVFDRHENILSFIVTDIKSKRRELQHLRRPGILGLELHWQYQIEPATRSYSRGEK